ncbi:MAG: hypothetical protein H6737_29215 [Alphaproteobacteria bacterium]|nr:hypothetical protein [Alphaproteobacteria bacterium]
MSIKLLTAGAALLVATPALARPISTLVVENRWEAPVTVAVDGQYVGQLGGFGQDAFAVRSGFHTVTVSAQNGTLLETNSEWFRPHCHELVVVETPMTRMSVTNTGSSPLYVAGPRAGLWVAPGQTHTAMVPAGKLTLTASISGPRGELRQVDAQTVWAEPGRSNRTAFSFHAAPTRLVVQNLDPWSVRLFVDGRAFGMLAPGATMALDVMPGVHDIDAIGRNGQVVADTHVRVAEGRDTRVDLQARRPPPPRPATYASAGHPHAHHR